jgi:oxygen-independent coproporphyrinogen III oxidase
LKTSLYIHIPFCISKCSYCDFYSVERTKSLVPNEYISSLCNEIEAKCKYYNVEELKTVYIGGGTPSLLSKEQFESITKTLRKIGISSDAEFTVEANPDDVNPELLSFLWDFGINRLSCGIQSLNEKSLTYVKRRASKNQCLSALNLLKNNWKGILSLDLIAGLPFETLESFYNGIKQICEFEPQHISLYSLTIEEGTLLEKEISSNIVDYDCDLSDKIWLYGRNILQENNYNQYEVSNFCKEGYECKHNLVYWNHENYIGCGCAATGSIYDEKGCCLRYSNKNNIKNYIDYWLNETSKNIFSYNENVVDIEKIDKNTSKFEFFMLGLRKLEGISSVDFQNKFSEEIPLSAKQLFYKWQKKGLVICRKENNDTIYSLSKKGILYLNQFLSELTFD